MARSARGATTRERELADRLHSAAIHLLRRARRGDPLTGATPAQLSALSVLMSGPKTLGELAAAEQVRPPTISRLAAEMQRIGLIRRRDDPDDARVARVEMSAKGRRVLGKGRKLRISDIERRVRRLDPRDVAALENAVTIIEGMLRD
ncbi:MAG TPA: MarR family transcriptional regulator [Candidatus Limnocylindria bacterium]|jgi:DNA-binding MarR family transcriptional regulator|nr:MarR family transcriptional regulator [Candidatus Limnocylindria bacterium]